MGKIVLSVIASILILGLLGFSFVDSAFAAVTEISINDISFTEGDSGTTSAIFTVSLDTPAPQAISVDYSTSDGTAIAPVDYVSISGTVIIPISFSSTTIVVDVNGDIVDELNETFFVTLSNPVGAAIVDDTGEGTIQNDDSVETLVGGTSIPIDTTALLVAGFNANSIWMIPTVLGIVGAGIAIFKLKRK